MVISKRLVWLLFFCVIALGPLKAQKKGKLERFVDKVYDRVEGDTSKPNRK